MPEIIALQDSVVYGPIHSRRLGYSLGINVLPVSRKVCSSNCVYCQYGWTLPEPAAGPERAKRVEGPALSEPQRVEGPALSEPQRVEGMKRAPELLAEIDEAFARCRQDGTPVDCITLAGNGEPTLHPDLVELVVGLKRMRDRDFPGASVGILSDATQLARSRVREALALLDARYLKFDAADEATWRRINDPLGRGDFHAMVDALRETPDVILQSMFIQGAYDNTGEAHLARWVEAVASIGPRSVQVYTVDRGTAAEGILEVPRAALQAIADRLTAATGIPTEVFD